jgi:hypothetical protein
MADKTDIQVTCEWLAADKSANQSNLVWKISVCNNYAYIF